MTTTIVGVFDEYSQAQQACEQLEAAGIAKTSIELSGAPSASDRPVERSTDPDDQPGVISRFFSDLFGTGDETFAANYSEAVRRGAAVVTLKVTDEQRVDELGDILEDCGAVDVDERVEQWKASGYVPPAQPQSMAGERRADDGDDTLKVVQEDLKIGKRAAQKGGVRVHETPVEEQVSLRDERATVRNTVRRTEVDVENFEDIPERARAGDEKLATTRRPYSGVDRRTNAGTLNSGAERRGSL